MAAETKEFYREKLTNLGYDVDAVDSVNQVAQMKSNSANSTPKSKKKESNENSTKIAEATDQDDYNTRTLNTLMKFWMLPRVTTIEEAIKRANFYFTTCSNDRMKPTLEGCALCFGTDRVTFKRWCDRYDPEVMDIYHIAQQCREFIQSFDAQAVIDGKMPAIPYIFRAKNNYNDYSDRTESVVKIEDNLGKRKSPNTILQSIAEDVIDAEFEEKM